MFFKKTEKILRIIVSIIFFVLMFLNTYLVLTKTAIFPRNYQEKIFYIKDNTILNIIFLIIFSIVIFLVSGYIRKKIIIEKFVILSMIYVFIISLLFAILRRDYVQFDPFNVIDQASNFLRNNYSGLERGENYLYIYSHQITTVFLFEIILGIFGKATFILYIFQSLSISYIIFMSYKVTNILFNDEEVDYLVIVLLLLCFPLIFYVAFIYGTLPGIVLVLTAFYNFIKYFQNKVWYNLVISMFSINIGILFISNNLINLLAMLVLSTLYILKKFDKKILYFFFGSLLLMIMFKNIVINYYEISSQKEIPEGIHKISWISMGMQEGDREAGWWNGFNYDIYIEENYDNDKVKEISLNSIKQRINVFKENPYYALDFYKRKYENQFLDPTFQSLLVSSPQEDFIYDTKLLKIKYIFLEELYYGTSNKILFVFMKVFQIFVYLGALIFSYIAIKEKKFLYLLIMLSFIGGSFFHIIWEAKSRYIFPYFIYLIPLSAKGIIFLKNKFLNFKS